MKTPAGVGGARGLHQRTRADLATRRRRIQREAAKEHIMAQGGKHASHTSPEGIAANKMLPSFLARSFALPLSPLPPLPLSPLRSQCLTFRTQKLLPHTRPARPSAYQHPHPHHHRHRMRHALFPADYCGSPLPPAQLATCVQTRSRQAPLRTARRHLRARQPSCLKHNGSRGSR